MNKELEYFSKKQRIKIIPNKTRQTANLTAQSPSNKSLRKQPPNKMTISINNLQIPLFNKERYLQSHTRPQSTLDFLVPDRHTSA